ncbi:SCP-like protein [Teladorsagia circumcincta]|uniref:SCP-like protein n=1 Tax=Teladorsagia circumcincta TaxID=45464 RepID=A0A2G9US50_TELCI|nr:SCP-like protein [Teladorsagia circumcincta]
MLTLFIFLFNLYAFCVGTGKAPDSQFCKNHGSFMDDTTRLKILEFHNGFRTLLVQGMSPGFQGGYLPPAKNLYKMRWNCDLEEKAMALTKNCSHSVNEKLLLGQNAYYAYDGDYVYEAGKHKVIKDAMYQWTMPAEYYDTKRAYKDYRVYTYANMAYQDIYEVGCNYEQCVDENNFVIEASVVCVYNKLVPKGAILYQKGDGTGCEKTPKVCKVKGSTCGGLLCELPPRNPPSLL